ncbi:MAG TPA: hypothetical protein VEI96_04165 [Thermodesulfovibrionales bacterium]|nr:hypothetical protein [Thermodesulfovibrionales bacterium]
MKIGRCAVFFVLTSMFVFAIATVTQAELTLCTPINQMLVPYTISVPGNYCLTSDLTSSSPTGNVITINASNVVLDLNDHRIGGQGAGLATQAVGIYANQRKNVIVRNGVVRGFYCGIQLDDTSGNTSLGNVVEGIRADSNTARGIMVVGFGNRIRYNQVINTGGTTVGTPDVYGIYSSGRAAVIRENIVGSTNGSSGAAVFGIYSSGATSVIGANAVSATREEAGETSYAIYLDALSADNMVDNNIMTNPALGPGTSTGLSVNGSNAIARDNTVFNMTYGLSFSGSSGIYKNNFAVGVTNPFTGGTPADPSVTNYHNP